MEQRGAFMARKKDKNPIDEREDMTVTLTLDDDR